MGRGFLSFSLAFVPAIVGQANAGHKEGCGRHYKYFFHLVCFIVVLEP